MYQYEMNDQYASDFTLIRKEHAIESINDFSSIFVSPKPTAPVSDGLDLLEQRVQLLSVIVAGIAWQNWGFV